MSPRLLPFLIVLATLAVGSSSAHGGTHHHPQVLDAHHYPDAPRRGEPVLVDANLNRTNLTGARLIYCRVQHYACGPALAMQTDQFDHTQAVIPWTSRFFEGVRTVGYRIELEFDNGTTASSPITHYPYRPIDLVAEADVYYYYSLPEESSGATLMALLAALVVAAVIRR